MTCKKVFGFPTGWAYVKITSHSIFLISKCNLAVHHVMTSPYQSVAKSILLVIKNNFGAISKFTSFLATDFKINWIEISFNGEVTVAIKSVNTVRSFKKQVADRRVVAYLLDIYLASIRETCLISLTQNGIQGLAPVMTGVQEGDWGRHYLLHTENRVIWNGCSIQIRSLGTGNRRKNLQYGFRSHAPDWEASTCKIELPWNQLSSHLRKHPFESISQVCYHLMVIEGKPSIFPGIRSSIVVPSLNWLPVSSSLNVILI